LILLPAIDVRGGRAVRLLQGDYERETVYDDDPAEAARRWIGEGAQLLHVVDLDGARAGRPCNLAAIEAIAALGCPVQVGGGLRDAGAVAATLASGADRVVIGTVALRDPELLDALVAEHGERVVVSVDAREGRVALQGWTESDGERAVDVIAALGARGVDRFLCTAIEVDGTMGGPAIGQLREIAAATEAKVLASGGVGSLSDLERLAALGSEAGNLEGAIVGRALYERRFSVAEGIAALI
jgi:phosphoribosylformimino-5-aminoimidazole carboxamide ribotide isomerase